MTPFICMSAFYVPGGSFNPNNPLFVGPTVAKVPVKFNIVKAGVTEIVDANGWATQFTIHVKALYLIGKDEQGLPAYEMESEIVPVVRRLMDDSMREPGVEAN